MTNALIIPDAIENVPNPLEGQAQVEKVLGRIEKTAGQLMDLNFEHRNTDDVWDWIPIVANFRSHALTKQEAQLIEFLGKDLQEADELITKYGLNMDLAALLEQSNTIKKPQGFTMLLGTLFPSIRSLHRGYVSRRVHKLRTAATESVRGAMSNIAPQESSSLG